MDTELQDACCGGQLLSQAEACLRVAAGERGEGSVHWDE